MNDFPFPCKVENLPTREGGAHLGAGTDEGSSPFEALSREQLIQRLEMEVWTAAVPHIAQHLAGQVIVLAGIKPDGVDLVMWIAHGSHHCNATALADWVARQMDNPIFQEASRKIPPPVVLARQIARLREKTEAANS